MEYKKRVLILGAGNAQIDAIEYCKSKGYEVVGCSYTAVDNGISYLNYFEQVDIKDVDGVVDIARKYQVKFIYSVGSDVAMPSVMKASKLLKLPYFIEPEIADICQSKIKMRAALGQGHEGNVGYIECSNIDDARAYNNYPGMMKPSDSQGQRGCFRVESFDDIRKEFQTSMDFSHEGKVIIEQFIDGPEVSLNAFFIDGRMVFGILSDRMSFEEYPGGIIKEHYLPSRLGNEIQEKAMKICAEFAKKLGINDGPCYFQIKVDKGIDPKIVEITPRLDGCHMWKLIKNYCDVDLLAASFELLEGKVPDLIPKKVEKNEAIKLEFFCQPPWTKFDRSRFDTSNTEYSFFYYQDGDKVRRLNGYIEKCGYAIKRLMQAN